MLNKTSYNIVIERFKAFADGHYLIRRFSHGQVDVTDIVQDNQYPWMHIVPVSMTPSDGAISYEFDVIFADLPRDKETPTEYQRESLSDCIRLAEDLISEIKNGGVIFGTDVTLETGTTIEPFIEEYTHTLTGVNCKLSMQFPNNWSACDIPADWSTGGSGSGGSGGGGTGLVLKVNGTNNAVQTLLDLVDGDNTTIQDLGDGRVQINSSGGGGSGTLSSTEYDVNHNSSFGNQYVVGDLVWYNGNIYRCIASNDAIIPTNASYWVLVGAGYRQRQTPADWNATTGDSQILNKPSIPTATSDLTNDSGFITSEDIPPIPTLTSELTNDSGFITLGDVPAQVNSDWNATSGVEEILNKPTIPTELRDLDDVDIITPLQNDTLLFNSATNEFINGQLGAVAYSNDYNDLDNLPSIPPIIGDMLKSTYDTDNDGIVDFAEALKTEVRNSTGATLYKGYIVYLSGSTGNLPNAVLAQANNDANSAQTFGVVYSDIPNNSDGYVITLGQINTLDTRAVAPNAFTSDTLLDGDVVYLSPTTAGHITRVKPSAPQHIVYVGMVVRTSPTNGTIQYRIQNGYELDEIHDVVATSPVDNDYMYYDASTSLYRLRQLTASRITDSTTVGQNLVKLTNPNAISYLRVNADNTITARTPAQLVSDLGISSSIILGRDFTGVTVSNTTTNTIAFSTEIPANTLQANDFIEFVSQLNTNTPNGTSTTYRVYVNTSLSLTGATQIATFNNTVGTGNTGFQRNIFITTIGASGNLRISPTANNNATSYVNSSVNASNITINTTASIFVILAIQMGNATSTASTAGTIVRLTR